MLLIFISTYQEFFYGLSLWYRRASQCGKIDYL